MVGKLVRRSVALALVAAAVALTAYAGWKWGDSIFPRLESAVGMGSDHDELSAGMTPEAAQAAAARILAFRESDEPELRLRSSEVSSLLRYSAPGLLPRGVMRPQVTMKGDRIDIRVSVLPRDMPRLPDLGVVAGILPDTVPVLVSASLVPFGSGGSILLIRAMEIQGIPIPSSAFPDILAALGRKDAAGLPASAMLVPSFGQIGGAYVEGGELVLVRA